MTNTTASSKFALNKCFEPPAHIIWGNVEYSTGFESGTDTEEELTRPKMRWKLPDSMQGVLIRSCSVSTLASDNQEDEDPIKEAQALQADLHKVGQCTPCHYLASRLFCRRGEDCVFCHQEHCKRGKFRPRKSKRAQCKKVAEDLDNVRESSTPDHFKEHVQGLMNQGSYMRMVVMSKLKLMFAADDGNADIAEILRQVAQMEGNSGGGEDDQATARDSGASSASRDW